MKNVKLDSVMSDGRTPILEIWGHLGAPEKLMELKSKYPWQFKSKTGMVDLIHADILANGIQGNIKKMDVTFDYYHSSRLPRAKAIHLDYCKFLILNNQKHMISSYLNSKKYSRDDLYENLVLPLFAACPPSVFVLHFDKMQSNVRTILLGDIRIRLLILRSHILEKKIKPINHLVKTIDPAIINQNPDILEGLYLVLKSILEKKADNFVSQKKKMEAFKAIPSKMPKDVTKLYPMLDLCHFDLEEELLKIKNVGNVELLQDQVFSRNRRLVKAYQDWAEYFLRNNRKVLGFCPSRDDFHLIAMAQMHGSISLEEMEGALIDMVKIMAHLKMRPSEKTIIAINRFFNMSRYIPSKWKYNLHRLQNNKLSEDPKVFGIAKSPLFSKFRYSVESKYVDDANVHALSLIDQGFNFVRSPEHFIMLVNLNIQTKNFQCLRALFRAYLKKYDLNNDDSFYCNAIFSMVRKGLYNETAELIDYVATTVNVFPESETIVDLISHISNQPTISRRLLMAANAVISYLDPEKVSSEIVEKAIYIAFTANKDLDIASRMFSLSLERQIKIGNWCYQQLLHIFGSHKRKDLLLKAVENYVGHGVTIMPINIAFEYFLSLKDLEGVRKVLRLVRTSSLELDNLSYKWILLGFASLDSNMKAAEALWNSVGPEAFSYSNIPYYTMILGYSRMKTDEADEKLIQMATDIIEKASANKLKFRAMEEIVSFMIEREFTECADYFLEVMHQKLKGDDN